MVANKNMKILITKEIEISEENQPLIEVVAKAVGFEEGNINDYVVSFLKRLEKDTVLQLISPVIQGYFGKVMKDKANEIQTQLENAVTVEVTIVE